MAAQVRPHISFRVRAVLEKVYSLAEKNKISIEETLVELKKRYDGYHFSRESKGMYNPFSVLNVFADKFFGAYWFATATPTFLVEMAKKVRFDIYKFENDTKIDIFIR